MSNESIIKKIKALRAKVSNAASTEAEVEAAAKIAAKLMLEHDIAESLLQGEGIELKATRGGTSSAFMNDLDWAIYFCTNSIGAYTETRNYKDRDGTYKYVGMSHDVEMALYLTELVTMSAKKGWLRYAATLLRDGTEKTRFARKGFYVGFSQACAKILTEMKQEREFARAEQARTSGTGTGIVLHKSNLIKAALKEMGLSLRKGSGTMGHVNGDAMNAGRKTAESINFNRPFAGNKSAGAIK